MPKRFRVTLESPSIRALTYFGILAILVPASGCRRTDVIEHYQVARPGPPHRMLGAVVPIGQREWFFKVTGANELVAGLADDFTKLIESIQVGEGEDVDPEWTLPAGWTEEPGAGMRFATIKIPTDEQELELTVIPLPKQPSVGLLDNINRWRTQLGLDPTDAAGLAQESVAIKLADTTATVVNLVGKSGASASAMSGPGINRGAGDPDAARIAAHAAAGVDDSAAVDAGPAPPSSITYEAPPEWKPGKRVTSQSAFAVPREAAFEVIEGERKAEISVTAMGPQAGGTLPNVNRWRNQVGLEPFSQEQLAGELKKIEIDGVQGEYVRLIGPQQAILGVIAAQGGKTWFMKLQGDHDLAVKLQEQFETFVRSIKF